MLNEITDEELKAVLRNHKIFITTHGMSGVQADLSYYNLKGCNLRDLVLDCADFKGADLEGADLSHSSFRGADFSFAKLKNTRLFWADFTYATFMDAILTDVNCLGTQFVETDFSYGTLEGVDFSGANLSRASFKHAFLKDILHDADTAFFAQACPEEGSFIGYKKASNKIVKLLILEDAERSSATTRKCRCSKAKVLSITNLDGSKAGVTSVASDYTSTFVYEVGKTVEVENFCEDRWRECAPGIHFFLTRAEAVNY